MEDKLFLACEGGLFSKLTTAKYRYGFMYQLRLGCGYLEHATKGSYQTLSSKKQAPLIVSQSPFLKKSMNI